MRCETCRELLWAYLEQELSAEEITEIKQHLTECADCRKELEIQREILETLQSLPDEELPEGYHEELMEKLQVEGTSNVVAFPQKKKAPKWKQLSMIAAAALIVVAAGGIKGMMQMREGQNEMVRQMEMAADAAAPMGTEEAADEVAPLEIEGAVEDGAMDEKAEQSVEMQQISSETADNGKEAASGAKKKSVPAEQNDSNAAKDEKKADLSTESSGAAMPKAVSIAEDETVAPYSMMRSAEPMAATDTATLQVSDLDTAMEAIREGITAAEGYEEIASGENSIYAVIPVENFETFGDTLKGVGELQWTKKGTLAEGDVYRSVEIQLYIK